MIRYFREALAVLALLGAHAVVQADVLSVRTLPARALATAGEDFVFTFNWQVSQDDAARGGVRSPGGTFFNAVSGAPLGLAVPTTLSSDQSGPQVLAEFVSVDSATLTAWFRQGVRRVGYRRPFIAVANGRALSGQLLIDLSRSTLDAAREAGPGELRVLRLELSFASGKRIELPPRDSNLAAQLTLSYAGSGVLRGRWQIAEPGSGAGAFFRTLSIVRQNLAPTQRATLASPRLPTSLDGRYVLRFCLEVAASLPSDDCGETSAGVRIFYEVAPDEAGSSIAGLAPDGGSVGLKSVFRWREVAGTAIYQLQIVRPVADHSEFVTGVLVPGAVPAAMLSQLASSKLIEGRRYRWRVTAHDSRGHLLARSDSAEFVYQP